MEAELFFIFVLALILFGPRKLPEIGRYIGKAMAEFRRAKSEFTAQIENEVRQLEEESKRMLPAETIDLEDGSRILPPTKAPEGTVISASEVASEPSVNGSGASQETHA